MANIIIERRDSPRFTMSLGVEVIEPVISTELSGRLSAISRTGCYIDTLNTLAPGTQVKVRLRRGEELFETPARVVYVSPRMGMGLCWGKNPPGKNLAVLNRWLNHI
jgi:hypothetical protein